MKAEQPDLINQGDLPPRPTKNPPAVRDNKLLVFSTPEDSGTGSAAMIMRAVSDPACDPAKMKELLSALKEMRLLDDASRYSAAMSAVQQEVPEVARDGYNSHTNSWYPKVAALNTSLKPIYTKHGLRISFGQAECGTDGFQRFTARVSFGLHNEDFFVDLPADNTGPSGKVNKTMVHAWKSTGTYAQGILIARIFNITIEDHDDDGNGGNAAVTTEQAANLKRWLEETKSDTIAFLSWGQCKTVDEFPASKYQEAVAMFRKKGVR
jgi:hypothetical protein